VIIPVKNMESTKEECLVSVQRNNPAEIIVVDGNEGQPSTRPLENSDYIVDSRLQDNTLRYYHGSGYVQEWLERAGKETGLVYTNGEFRIYKAATGTRTKGLAPEGRTP